MATYELTLEDGSIYQVDTEEPTTGNTLTGKVSVSDYNSGKRNLLGNIVDRPSAAIRGALQNPRNPIEGYKQGTINPGSVPGFQEQWLDAYYKKFGVNPLTLPGGNLVSAGGLAADLATNPANLLMMLAGKTPMGGGRNLAGLIGESRPYQALEELGNKPVGDLVPKILMSEKGGALPKVSTPKFMTSGVPKEEVARIQTNYGTSNAGLVDTIKTKLNDKINLADKTYQTVMANAPEGKQINIRPAIEQAGARLKRLGLVTDSGKLTQLGQSEIGKDSVYGKLLDFYQSADAISGVANLEGKALTQGQILKVSKASRETLVNKDQYTFLRDKLNALYKNKPSDVDVSRVVNQFYADGENSGLVGLQKARALSKQAYQNESKFLNKNTGDLKIATEQKLSRIGTDKPLSKQEIDHIRELEVYTGHPILKDAVSINKINKHLLRIKNIKGKLRDTALTALGLEGARKVVTGRF